MFTFLTELFGDELAVEFFFSFSYSTGSLPWRLRREMLDQVRVDNALQLDRAAGVQALQRVHDVEFIDMRELELQGAQSGPRLCAKALHVDEAV